MLRVMGPAIMYSGGGVHGDTGTSSGSRTLKQGELQRVAGIRSGREIVHKSVLALAGDAVPVSASSRLLLPAPGLASVPANSSVRALYSSFHGRVKAKNFHRLAVRQNLH